MGKHAVENQVSKADPAHLKIIRNSPEEVQRMLWKIALYGRTRTPIEGIGHREFFCCSEKE